MEGVKFSREENPEDEHDKKSKEEGRDTLSGSRRARRVCQMLITAAFGLFALILNVQKSDLLCKNAAQSSRRKLGFSVDSN